MTTFHDKKLKGTCLCFKEDWRMFEFIGDDPIKKQSTLMFIVLAWMEACKFTILCNLCYINSSPFHLGPIWVSAYIEHVIELHTFIFF